MTEETTSRRPKASWIHWMLTIGLLAFGGQQLAAGVLRYYQPKTASAQSNTHANDASATSAKPKPKLGKIRREGSEQFLWAKGSKNPKEASSEWFDMSNSPVKLEQVQYGIGKDTIPSIDHPIFVAPDDPALLERWHAKKTSDLNRLSVIGYAHNGDVRAYPIKLLNRHELVNDTVGGKPVTVGW